MVFIRLVLDLRLAVKQLAFQAMLIKPILEASQKSEQLEDVKRLRARYYQLSDYRRELGTKINLLRVADQSSVSALAAKRGLGILKQVDRDLTNEMVDLQGT